MLTSTVCVQLDLVNRLLYERELKLNSTVKYSISTSTINDGYDGHELSSLFFSS